VYGDYRPLDQTRIRGQADLIYIDGVFYLMLVVDIPEEKPTMFSLRFCQQREPEIAV